MSDYGDSYEAAGQTGPVQFEFVDAPALDGETVEWTFRTTGGRTAPAGTVATQIAVMSHDHRILGGGSTTLHNELGPHDVGGGRFSPAQYTRDDGDYYLTITVGDDVKYVQYRVDDRGIRAI
jgi:hypothetical protein